MSASFVRHVVHATLVGGLHWAVGLAQQKHSYLVFCLSLYLSLYLSLPSPLPLCNGDKSMDRRPKQMSNASNPLLPFLASSNVVSLLDCKFRCLCRSASTRWDVTCHRDRVSDCAARQPLVRLQLLLPLVSASIRLLFGDCRHPSNTPWNLASGPKSRRSYLHTSNPYP